MKLRKIKIFVLIFITALSFSNTAQAEIDAKFKALGSMAIYGSIGGALLGTATLAFDGGGRNIAKGASLGLYLGLLFGGYVVLSHHLKKKGYFNRQDDSGDDYYPDSSQDDSPYGDEGAETRQRPVGTSYSLWAPYMEAELSALSIKGQYNDPLDSPAKYFPEIYIPLVNYRF